MIVERAEIIDQWVNVGDGMGSLLFSAYSSAMPGLTVEDITNQSDGNITPKPNAYTVLVKVPNTIYIDQIEADGWPILWREEIVEDII